ncbi:MAG: LamG domain-containing protein [Opitutaceae bacterium]|jgi:hypothetical protein|nr:LamG domain-containing protein [Opitutaceae bacterium]
MNNRSKPANIASLVVIAATLCVANPARAQDAAPTPTPTPELAPEPVLFLDGAGYSCLPGDSAGGTWVDRSASHNNAVSQNYWLSPALKTNATPNGKNSVDFYNNGYRNDSEGDLAWAKPLKLATALDSAAFTTAPTFTLTFLAKIDAPTGTNPVMLFGTTTSGALAYRINTAGTQTLTRYGTGDVANSPATEGNVYTFGTWAIFTVTYDYQAGTRMYLNDKMVWSNTALNISFTASALTLIGSTPFQGEIAAVKVYDSVLSTGQLTADYTALIASYITAAPETPAVPEPENTAAFLGAFMAAAGAVLVTLRNRKHVR